MLQFELAPCLWVTLISILEGARLGSNNWGRGQGLQKVQNAYVPLLAKPMPRLSYRTRQGPGT